MLMQTMLQITFRFMSVDFICSTGHFHSEYNLWHSDQMNSLFNFAGWFVHCIWHSQSKTSFSCASLFKGITMVHLDPFTSARRAPPSRTRNTATCSETSAHAVNRSATWRRLQKAARTVRMTQGCQASVTKTLYTWWHLWITSLMKICIVSGILHSYWQPFLLFILLRCIYRQNLD